MELTLDQALQKGVEAHKAGKAQEADRYYTAILKANPKHPDVNHNMGVLAVGVGKVEAALSFFKTALEVNPNIAQYWLSYIDALIKLDRITDAKAVFDQAKSKGAKGDGFDQIEVRLKTSSVEVQNKTQQEIPTQPNILDELNLDKALKLANKKVKDGLNEDAKKIYQDILKKFPKNKKASDAIKIMKEPTSDQLHGLVNLYTQGQYPEALEKATRLLNQFPNSFNLYNIVGAANKSLGKLEGAVEAYTKALSIKPDYADAYNNMGVALREQGKLEEAIEAYTKALSIKPDYAEAYNNMGVSLKKQGKLDRAIEAYTKALSIKPDYAEAYNNMGIPLNDQLKLEEAIEAFNKALSIKPDYAEAYNNMGNTLKNQGKIEKAIEAFNKALSIKPNYAEAHHNLSFVLLNIGKLREGLDEYEWRFQTRDRLSSARFFSKPLWDGQKSLEGKTILVWSEQGVGDTINWSSGLSFVASKAAHCILECQKKLVPLLARSLPNVEVKPENRSLDSQRNDFDFHLPLGSLYRHIIPTGYTDSIGAPFLVPDPGRIKLWQERLNSLGKSPYIGVSWKSSNMAPERLPNYASISDLSPVLKMPNLTFINLQYKDFKEDLTKIHDEIGVKVHNFDDLDQFENLEDVAALSAALDIVVSTQSVVPLISARVGTITKLARWKQGSWSNNLFEPVGPLVDIFERNTLDSWDDIFKSIAKDIACQTENWRLKSKNLNDKGSVK